MLRRLALSYNIPGAASIELDHLVLDINGTLTDRGELIDGVAERIGRLAESVEIHLVSSDTRGTLSDLADRLNAHAVSVPNGGAKREFVERLGTERCAAIGNGMNDLELLDTVRLGIAVIGPEGAAASTVAAADAVCTDIRAALDLLLDDSLLISTLRP
jgi:soluble P-type ATPase